MSDPAPPPVRMIPRESAVLAVDVQQRLLPVMAEPEALERRVAPFVEAALALGVPVLRTEQAPEKLGETAIEPLTRADALAVTASKTAFSACVEPVLETLRARAIRNVVLVGIEAHVCVLQTALDLLGLGFAPVVARDGIASRRATDRDAAVERMIQAGVVPTTVESVVMEWVADAASPDFKSVLPLIKSL